MSDEKLRDDELPKYWRDMVREWEIMWFGIDLSNLKWRIEWWNMLYGWSARECERRILRAVFGRG